jgi:DnaJ homolog subfamily B member 12
MCFPLFQNSAPHSDEAFKAVGLAYATLSDAHKRTIYDRYGEEDPDNRGGSGGGGMRQAGQEMSPEDIFNAFFGGGMPGGGGMGPGVHFYSTGFGGPMHFQYGGGPRRRQQQQTRAQQQQQEQQAAWGMLMQFIPILLFVVLSFLSQSSTSLNAVPGENQYFSLVVRRWCSQREELHECVAYLLSVCFWYF